MTDSVANIGKLHVQVDIDAPPDVVWEGLTKSIGEWWPAEFYTGGDPGSRTMAVELAPGGRMFETWSSGGGTLWGTVVSFTPAKSLQIVGQQFPDWGGPSQWYGTWALERNGDKTRLSFSEATLGRVSKDGLGEKESGWQFLSACLKAFVEKTEAPAWPS